MISGCQHPPTKSNFDPTGGDVGFKPPPVWNGSMQNLKAHLINLEPYIFDKSKFSAKENEEFIKNEMHELTIQASYVKHDPVVSTKDPTVKFVANQFAEELQQAGENFEDGWKEYSRSQLMKVTTFCVACHTRFRQGPEFKDSIHPTYVSSLSPRNQVELHVAFREFDKAFLLSANSLATDASTFTNETDMYAIALLGLQVAAQFQNDKEKANQLLRIIEKNKTAPTYLKLANERWKKSVSRWDPNQTFHQLSDIRSLINERQSEIDDMRALAALLTMLGDKVAENQLGETLFLTGQSYEFLGSASSLSLQDNYYEACVRKVPKTVWGRRCFDNLERSVHANYTGLLKLGLPKDVQKKMESLKKILN